VNGATPSGLLGLLLLVLLALAVLVYVFLRMSGVLGHDKHGRPPPPTPMG